MPIYFIQAGDDGPVKIGLARDVWKRLSNLQTGVPTRLRLLGIIDGSAQKEKLLHRQFAAHRLRGEWFSFHPSMLEGTTQLPPPTPKIPRHDEPTNKLAEWLFNKGQRRSSFASLLDTSPGYITDLCQGRTRPSLAMAQRIMEATNGDVKPEDFFEDAAQ
jgi:hypothetical protein